VAFDPPVAEFPPVLVEPPVAEFPPVLLEPPVAELPPALDVPPEPKLPPVEVLPPEPLPPVELAPPEPMGWLFVELLQPAKARMARVAIVRILVRGSIICSMARILSFDHASAQFDRGPRVDGFAMPGSGN
jgi:hypothetical protein